MGSKIIYKGKEFLGKIIKFSVDEGNEIQFFDFKTRNILEFNLLDIDQFTTKNRRSGKKINHLSFIKYNYDRECKVDLSQVLPFIGKESKLTFNEIEVGLTSNRLLCFSNGLICKHCGIEGKFFAVEKSKRKNTSVEFKDYHLNLYAIAKFDREVLMTADHIVPKSRGGVDNISNLQTLCTICNKKKDNKLETELD